MIILKAFLILSLTFVDIFAPPINITNKEHSFLLKPWITNSIKSRMKIGDNLLKSYCSEKNNPLKV